MFMSFPNLLLLDCRALKAKDHIEAISLKGPRWPEMIKNGAVHGICGSQAAQNMQQGNKETRNIKEHTQVDWMENQHGEPSNMLISCLAFKSFCSKPFQLPITWNQTPAVLTCTDMCASIASSHFWSANWNHESPHLLVLTNIRDVRWCVFAVLVCWCLLSHGHW